MYYRVYKSIRRVARHRDPEFRAYSVVCAVKSIYLLSIFIVPLDVFFFNNSKLVSILYVVASIVLLFNKATRKKYHEMIPLWNSETKYQKIYRTIYLIIFSVFPLILICIIAYISKLFVGYVNN